MRRICMLLLVLFALAVPWEYAVDLGPPWGSLARLIGLALLGLSVLSAAHAGSARPLGALQWVVLALLLWLCCSCFWSVDADASMVRLRGYLQEMAMVWLVWEFAESRTDLRWLLRAYVAGSWILAVLTLASVKDVRLAGMIRFVSPGQDPNDVARFLDFGFSLAALLVSWDGEWPDKLLGLSYLPAGFAAVLLTGSRSGLIAALVAITGSAVLLARYRGRVSSLALGLLPVLLAGAALLMPHATLERLATIPEQLQRGDLNQRLNIWDAGWRAFAHAPFLGTGAGTFVSAAGLSPLDTAHNSALSLAVEGGIFALILGSVVVAVSIGSVVRMRGPERLAFGTALLVWLTTSLVATVEETRTTWLLLGMISVAARFAVRTPQQCLWNVSGECV